MSQSPRIAQLAEDITKSVTKLLEILSTQGVPAPSFDDDGPFFLPKEASNAQDIILDATAELHELLMEPLNLVYKQGGHNNSVCLQAISRFDIASMVPPGGMISYGDIAVRTGLSEQMIRRLLRSAISMRIFQEPEPNMVAHTKSSKMLANPLANDWLRTGTEAMWPANVKMIDALVKWPNSTEVNETVQPPIMSPHGFRNWLVPNSYGFSLAQNTSQSIYDVIGSDPERAVRFANSMKLFATRAEYDPSFIVDYYDWASLGSAKVIDVGGARGHIAVQLANRFDNLNILVQDMDKVVENAEDDVPENLKDRVTFMAHDLFAPQNVQADIIFFRWIMHNWPDKQCISILRAQIPIFKAGVRIIIQDVCLAEPGTIPLWREKFQRMEDLNMGAAFNARERTVSEWKILLREADPRFLLKSVVEPPGSALGIIEVVWNDPNYSAHI